MIYKVTYRPTGKKRSRTEYLETFDGYSWMRALEKCEIEYYRIEIIVT